MTTSAPRSISSSRETEPIDLDLDLDRIARFLTERCSPAFDFAGLTVGYLKLRSSGPILAVLQARSSSGYAITVTARWADRAKGVRLADRLNERYRRYRSRFRDRGEMQSTGLPGCLPGLDQAAIYAPDLGLLLIAFPFDRRLQTLALIADARCLRGPLQQAMAPLTGDAPIGDIDIRPVRYKPESKCVFRIEIDWVADNEDLPAVLYAKVAKDAIFDRTNQVTPALAQLGANCEFVQARRVAVIEDLNLELLSEVPGRPMSDLLVDGAGRGLGQTTGRALRSLHGQSVNLPTVRTGQDHLRLLADNADQLARFRPTRRSTIGYLRSEIDRRLRLDPPKPAGVCHNDFHGGNVLADAALGLIDFEDAAMGDPATDVGSMYAHLTDLADRHPGQRRAILAERTGFLVAYDVADLGHRMAAYAAMHCMLLAYQSLRYPSDDSERTIESMLGEATTLLSGASP